eukprot:93523_1
MEWSAVLFCHLSNLAISITATAPPTMSTNYVTIASSCNEMDRDGLYYIKPLEDGAVIPVICNNGYAMLDVSLDAHLESYPSYLTSYTYARDSFDWILPTLDDTSTFREWFTPSDTETKFRVAPQCRSCESSNDFGDDVVYYTDSALFCFATTPISGCSADFMLNDYACNVCDVGIFDSEDIRSWTKCTALQMQSDTPINYDHDQCVTHGLLYRPVMSFIRDACTCYQPSTSVTYQVSREDLPEVTLNVNVTSFHVKYIDDAIVFADDDELTDDENCEDNIVYLTNNDLSDGTYRIRECGEYILAEDIVFNFNAPSPDADDIDSPNSIDVDDLHWFPTHEQDESGAYPGTYSYAGSYSLGFFAGITVESDNVRINLNGYSLSMDYTFYFQQRYFTLIECGAKYFLPNQGPSNWLIEEEFYASNVEIFGPGTLGLSSHHGIHGMRNDNLYIHHVNVTSFEVAGVQCNGCNNVRLEYATIGPQNTQIPVLGRYAHARALLPRLKELNEAFGSEMITFSNRLALSVSDLVYRLVNQMDMIYDHVIDGVQFDANDDEWIATQKLFLNRVGWMDGGSSYGAVFSGDGAAVVGMGSRTQYTGNISMNHVEIFGIYNAVIEKIKVSVNKVGATRLILFDTLDWIAVTSSIEDGATAQYIGDAYTDCIFAIQQHITSWAFLNSLYITDAELSYVFDGDSFRGIWDGGSPAQNDQSATGCNTDIQLHSSKGAIGLRLDGAQNVDLRNLNIHDVVNWADLGANWCGLSDGPGVSNEDVDIQYGYTGTRAHGLAIDYVQGMIENVSISAIESLNGEAVAMNVYKGCDVQIDAIHVKSVGAGTKLSMMDVEQLTLPNLVPRACAIDIHNQSDVTGLTRVTQIKLNGHEKCNFIRSVQDEKSNFMHYIETHYTTAAMLTVCCAAFILISFIIITKDYFNSKQTQQHKITNEFTPLLI